jgi:hypothetical protein
VAIILCFPTVRPVTKLNMNYASVITTGVVFLSLCVLLFLFSHSISHPLPARDQRELNDAYSVWYILGGRRHYKGPMGNASASVVMHNSNTTPEIFAEDEKKSPA